MAKFITGKELEDAVYSIIWDAEETLLIVSPFVKLDNYFKKLFERHLDNHKLHLLVVFGKNEGNESRSLGKADFDFFKQFTNVSIIYEPKLHAKYYGNEKKGVISSINLYDYSFKNNIEFGVYSETGILNALSNQSDKGAWNKSWEIAEGGAAIFIKRPVFKKSFLGALTGGRDYIKAEVLLDITETIYSNNSSRSRSKRFLAEFPESVDADTKVKSEVMPTRAEVESKAVGFCIRTGTEIPFDPSRPFCESAYRTWSQFKNLDYPEQYCHKTGNKSYGKTSMRHPILT